MVILIGMAAAGLSSGRRPGGPVTDWWEFATGRGSRRVPTAARRKGPRRYPRRPRMFER